ncbi:MAG: FtsK/SpoIIIE domain-containing protein [Chloroflexota bacterium]
MSLDERFVIGLKMLERLRPSLRARRANQPTTARTHLPAADNLELEEEPVEERRLEAPVTEWRPDAQTGLPSMETLLEQLGETAPCSVVLGVCEDGLPFLLDLTNPAPGALLLAGDQASGKTRLLRSVLASAVYLNDPDQVAFYLVAQRPDEFIDLAGADHCQQFSAVQDKGLDELVAELASLAEERRRGQQDGPAILLVIDDLTSCLEVIDEQAYNRLYWLIRHGPRSRVWTLASLCMQKANNIDPRFLSAFRTRLFGHIADRRQSGALAGDKRLDTRRLESGYEFCVPYGDEWVHFWICDPEGAEDDYPIEEEEE